MSAFINSLKSATSRVLKRLYPEIRKKLWKERFWSNSYCLITVGGAPLEVVKRYIESQNAPEVH
jgi:putative transposase